MTPNFKTFTGQPAGAKSHSLTAALDGKEATTLADFYQKMTAIFHLPDYFGKNLDALSEVLSDLSWIKEKHVDFIIRNYNDLLSKETPEVRLNVLRVLNQAGDEWKQAKGPHKLDFHIHVEASPEFDKDLKTVAG